MIRLFFFKSVLHFNEIFIPIGYLLQKTSHLKRIGYFDSFHQYCQTLFSRLSYDKEKLVIFWGHLNISVPSQLMIANIIMKRRWPPLCPSVLPVFSVLSLYVMLLWKNRLLIVCCCNLHATFPCTVNYEKNICKVLYDIPGPFLMSPCSSMCCLITSGRKWNLSFVWIRLAVRYVSLFTIAHEIGFDASIDCFQCQQQHVIYILLGYNSPFC